MKSDERNAEFFSYIKKCGKPLGANLINYCYLVYYFTVVINQRLSQMPMSLAFGGILLSKEGI